MEIRDFSRVIGCLFAIDILLGLFYVADWWAGMPFFFISRLVSLQWEMSLASWYSTVQLFALALALLLLWWSSCRLDGGRHLSLALFAALVFLMSCDEAISLHERLGMVMTKAIAAKEARGVFAERTGYWPYVLGLPAAALLGATLYFAARSLGDAPLARMKLAIGMAMLLIGAVGLESWWNFASDGAMADVVEPWLEETLEMLGVTIMLWGALQGLERRGVVIALRRSSS